MKTIHHALVLNLHQPAGNLEQLLDNNEWGAKTILYALDRIPRSLWQDEDLARVHLSLSGTLLETLRSEDFQRRVYGTVDCGSLLWHLQNEKLFDVLGTAYYHPILPLISPEDQYEQLLRWKGIGEHQFWKQAFTGFWPPEMGFSMELIPLIKRMGYEYVIVDSGSVEPVSPMTRSFLLYQPHIARYGDEQITVIIRDGELSEAQESGMTVAWFRDQVEQRTKDCDFEPLVTTCTDGDNGDWFRNMSGEENFWSSFYQPFLQEARDGKHAIRPVFIRDYLKRFSPVGEVRVMASPRNTNWHHGQGFTQWIGSDLQQGGIARANRLSVRVHQARKRADQLGPQSPELGFELESALWHVLRAQTSCNFYWGESWLQKCHQDLDAAEAALDRAEGILPVLKQLRQEGA